MALTLLKKVVRQFHIYKIEKVNQDPNAQRTQGYDIYFTSKEYYYNYMTKVSRAYSDLLKMLLKIYYATKNI